MNRTRIYCLEGSCNNHYTTRPSCSTGDFRRIYTTHAIGHTTWSVNIVLSNLQAGRSGDAKTYLSGKGHETSALSSPANSLSQRDSQTLSIGSGGAAGGVQGAGLRAAEVGSQSRTVKVCIKLRNKVMGLTNIRRYEEFPRRSSSIHYYVLL